MDMSGRGKKRHQSREGRNLARKEIAAEELTPVKNAFIMRKGMLCENGKKKDKRGLARIRKKRHGRPQICTFRLVVMFRLREKPGQQEQQIGLEHWKEEVSGVGGQQKSLPSERVLTMIRGLRDQRSGEK